MSILIFSYSHIDIYIFLSSSICRTICMGKSPPVRMGGWMILMRNEKRRDNADYVRQNVQYLNSH